MGTETALPAFRKSLRAAHLRYAVLPLVNAHSLLVTEHWGKVFGPFKGDKDCGTLWVSPKAAGPGSLGDMVKSGDWCAGGDRLRLVVRQFFNNSSSRYVDEPAMNRGAVGDAVQGKTREREKNRRAAPRHGGLVLELI